MGNKVLVTGCNGQLGVALQKIKPSDVEMLALDRSKLDITNFSQVVDVVASFNPDWIINAAAYTAVDKAESESELAFLINRNGAENLARSAESIGARLVQVSTDYVFDGSQGMPYKPDDQVNPINVYGESKLGGEIAVRKILGDEALILRTAWVYAHHGKNFLTTMLRLMKERKVLNVVEDQIGTPTNAYTLADAIFSAIKNKSFGTHHWTDAGVASWYDFANSIYESATAAKILTNRCHIAPIPAEAYPTPAKRPVCSLLDKQSFRKCINEDGDHWQNALTRALDSIVREGCSEINVSPR